MSPLAQFIEGLLLKGCTRHLVQEAIEKEYPEDPKPGKELVDAAYVECVDAWVKNAGEDPDTIHAFHIRSRKFLYQKSLQINDYKTCLAILKDLAELEKQYGHQIKKAKEAENEETEVRKYLEVIHGGKKERKQPTDNRRTDKAARG
jgi:hypothetical protein